MMNDKYYVFSVVGLLHELAYCSATSAQKSLQYVQYVEAYNMWNALIVATFELYKFIIISLRQ